MRLPFLLLLFFISLTCFNINAEEIILREPKIGNTDIKFSDFGGSATVITEQDIKASGATEIHQLLREVPGLSVKRAGARGGMISIFARGSESDHNLVLIDGVKANEIGGAFNFEFLSLNNIEKIEILRGPQAALYGAGAIGSVISITTKKPEKKTNVSFKSAFGFNQGPKKDSNGPLKDSHTDGGKFFVNEQYFSINGPISKNNESDVFLGYSLGFERINDDGYRRFNDHYENGALNGSMLLKTKDEKIKILFNGTRRKTKYNFPTDTNSSVDHQYAKTARDRRHMTIRSLNFEYKFYDSLTYGTTYKYNYLHKWAQNSTVQVSTDLNWWEKREGFDYYMKSNNNLGVFNIKTLIGYEKINESSNYDSFNASGYTGYYGHNDYTKSYYANIAIKAPYSIFINPGIRKNKHEQHGEVTNPSIFASKVINQTSTKLRGGYSKGIKYPGIYESYAADKLEAERSKSYEFGLDQKISRNSSISITYFNTKTYDLIAYRAVGETYQNLDDAELKGYEFSGKTNLSYGGKLKAWYTYLKTKAVNTTNATQTGAFNLANWYSNEPLLRRPKHSGGFGIGQYKDAYSINFDGIYTGGRWDFENSSTRKWNKNFWDFNLYGDYSIRRNQKNNSEMKVFINIENVFNDKRQEVLNQTSPGRSIMTGIKVNL